MYPITPSIACNPKVDSLNLPMANMKGNKLSKGGKISGGKEY